MSRNTALSCGVRLSWGTVKVGIMRNLDGERMSTSHPMCSNHARLQGLPSMKYMTKSSTRSMTKMNLSSIHNMIGADKVWKRSCRNAVSKTIQVINILCRH